MQTSADDPRLATLKTITAVVYALQAAFFIAGLTALVGVIINYVKRDDVRATWLESHFLWQIRTFWWALLWFTISGLLFLTILLIPFAWLGCLANSIWIIYRVVKGWLDLYEGKPMYRAAVPALPPAA